MSPNAEPSIREELEQSWLTWSALNHLLPAPILRELFYVIVSTISQKTIVLDDLFEELSISGPRGLESWYVRLQDVREPLPRYLQNRLQHLLWRNDSDAYPPDDDTNSRSALPQSLEVAIQVGRSDFGSDLSRLVLPLGEASLVQLVRIIERGKDLIRSDQLDQFPSEVRVNLAETPAVLAVAIAKHVGDLCADADFWQPAKALYEFSQQRLSTVRHEGWNSFVSGIADILRQSIANAARAFEGGAGRTLALLHQSLERTSLRDTPVFVMNAGFDALAVQIATGSLLSYDRRATLLAPAYSHDSYGLSTAWEYLNDRNFASAQRHCWSILRRQIALGLASETRVTKSMFGRVILASLEDSNQTEPDAFALLVRLLVESGDDAIGKLNWPQSVIDKYVNADAVANVLKIARRHAGLRVERERVAIELMRHWLLRISGDREDVAYDMMAYLAETTQTGSVTFLANQDLGGRGLEILKDVAKARPEFLKPSAASLVSVIEAKLRSEEFWTAKSRAIELALACADDFSPEQTRGLVQCTLSMLGAQNRAAQMWPIVQPALEFLTCAPALELYRTNVEIKQNALDTIIRVGMRETMGSQLIFYLRDFDPELLRDKRIAVTLEPVVADLRNKVLAVNSSATAGEIQALLLSPSISGADGVKDALRALKIAISSCHEERPRLALPYSYAALLMLSDRQKTFADELDLPRPAIDELWREIYETVVDFWDQIAKKPGLLASFSLIPRQESNPVLVHNWAFASLRFAESLDRGAEMEMFISRAGEKQESLRGPIQRAAVIGALTDKDVAISPGEIEDEAPDVFYDGIGRRLLVMDSLAPAAAAQLCEVLLGRCMRFGPRGIDAAVLLGAKRLGLAERLDHALATSYSKRVDADRDLRLGLLPLLSALGVRVR